MKEYLISNSDHTADQILGNPELSVSDYNRISNADVAQSLLVLRDNDKLILIEGIYRLAKSALVQDQDIHVKIITKHQLEKALLEPTTITGGSIRKAGYYLFGVSQNNASVSNIGAGYSVAAALNMSFAEFVEKSILFFKSYNGDLDYFHILHNGEMAEYFLSFEDMLEYMFGLFVEEGSLFMINDQYLKKFSGWNELFIEFVEICFGKKILLLDDTSVDVSGTSIKSANATENIEFILSNFTSLSGATNIDDIIPDVSLGGVHEYILLLRKRKKSKTLFSSNYVYYPIFLFVPQTFFKNLQIEKKVFTNKDEITQLIRKVLHDVINKMPIISLDFIDLNVVQQFANKNDISMAIDRYYINKQNVCYALSVSFIPDSSRRRCSTIWPIQYSRVPPSIPNELKDFEPYKRSDIRQVKFAECKILYENYNKFIVQLSEEKGYYQTSPEESEYKSVWNQREKTVLPPNPFIKVEKFLGLGDNIIGFVSRGLYYYFEPASAKPAIYASLVEEAMKKYSILADGFKKLQAKYSIYHLLYDPDDVNTNLTSSQEDNISEYKEKLSEALYKRYVYNIFVIELISSLDNERNQGARKELHEILSKANFKKPLDLENAHNKIEKLLIDFPNDILRIKQYINKILAEDFNKRKILENIKEDVFEFDRKTLHHWKILASSENVEKLSEAIKKQAKQIVQVVKKSAKRTETMPFPKVFVPCVYSPNSPYCKGKKLLIDEKDYPNLISLLVSDLLNPLKKEYLFSSIIMVNTRDNFRFTRKKGEEIYCKLE